MSNNFQIVPARRFEDLRIGDERQQQVMMTIPESTSAEAFNQYVSGRLVAASNGWKNLLVRIYSEPRVEERVIYPAVAEPRIVRILSGAAVVEEREPGGPGSRPTSKPEIFS